MGEVCSWTFQQLSALFYFGGQAMSRIDLEELRTLNLDLTGLAFLDLRIDVTIRDGQVAGEKWAAFLSATDCTGGHGATLEEAVRDALAKIKGSPRTLSGGITP
jgi:hypothetical protein